MAVSESAGQISASPFALFAPFVVNWILAPLSGCWRLFGELSGGVVADSSTARLFSFSPPGCGPFAMEFRLFAVENVLPAAGQRVPASAASLDFVDQRLHKNVSMRVVLDWLVALAIA